ICILCTEEIPSNRRHRLFDDKNVKTDACNKLEQCVCIQIQQSTDFRIICENCLRSVSNITKKQNLKIEVFQDGRKHGEQKFIRTKIKRLSKGNKEPNSRKKLSSQFDGLKLGAKNSTMKMTVTDEKGSTEAEIHIPKQQQKLIKLAMANNKKHLLNYILTSIKPEDCEIENIVMKFVQKKYQT
uniref:Uncharacterized protein n=1 Tax=Clytia hemisphaerica TaxID=252671 RepID=A0A7M5XMD7_9CNID